MLRARVPRLRYPPIQALARRGPRPVQLARYSTPAEPQQQQQQQQQVVRISGWRRTLQAIGRITIGTVILAGAGFYYVAHQERTPGPQLPHDPTKKTLVVLGSGWGATSFLKKLDTADYNVVVISPHNYFLFTPLLPSVSTGTLSPKSIISSTRYITRHKARQVSVIEAEAKSIDSVNKTVTFSDSSDIKGAVSTTTIPYDYLIYAVGAETQTFGIPGVKEHTCFMKELHDAEKMQDRFLDCVESAGFPGQGPEEIDRLLHMVVVGGGPTGIELSGEIHDFLEEDLKYWYPELAGRMKITLVEALPSVLPTFSKTLIDYTESTFKEAKIDILTKTMVKEVKEKSVVLQMPDKSMKEVPCGMVVWAAGNTLRALTKDLMGQFPSVQINRRGLTVDGHLRVMGADGIFALGDCTATSYAPTAQVASQQGAYLAKFFNKLAKKEDLLVEKQGLESTQVPEDKSGEVKNKLGAIEKQLQKLENPRPFHYSHQGSLAYIGSERAIADLPFMNGTFATGGLATYYFWRSAYLSTLFSVRNRTLVATDWIKVKLFGRDVSRES